MEQLGNPLTTLTASKIKAVCRECGKEHEIISDAISSRKNYVFFCDDCKRKDREKNAERRREEQENHLRWLKEKQARQWDKLCPPLYQVTDVARLPQKQYAEIMEWGYDSCGLMLIGATGKGKTRCLYELLRRLFLDDGFEVIVFNCVDFGHECVRQFMSSDPDGVTDWLTRLATVDILVLDDLGKAKFTERVESELYGLIEARTANMLPILATSNFTGDAFAAKLTEDRGMAMIRRLREFCKVVIFD